MKESQLKKEARNIARHLANHRKLYGEPPIVLMIDVSGTDLTFIAGPATIKDLETDPYNTLKTMFNF